MNQIAVRNKKQKIKLLIYKKYGFGIILNFRISAKKLKFGLGAKFKIFKIFWHILQSCGSV